MFEALFSAKCLIGVQDNRGDGQGDFDNVQIKEDFFSPDSFPNKIICKNIFWTIEWGWKPMKNMMDSVLNKQLQIKF